MFHRRSGAVALCAALASIACTRAAPALSDPAEAARSAELAVRQSRSCAGELDRVAGEDPATVARVLGIAPAILAPHARSSAAPVRAEIAERLERARTDAAAASSLARAAEDPGAAASASRRALRSLATSSELCRAADLVRGDRLARSR
jgi:hypothetical protein